MKKIIVVGSSNADITGRARHLPVNGETVLGTTMMIGPGGKGMNQATAAHRAAVGADCEVVYISRIGNDTFGRVLLDHMKAEGMSDKYIVLSDTDATGSALIEVDEESGQNRIVVIPAANANMSPEDVAAADAEFAECSAVLCQLEIDLVTVKKAKELAAKYNRPFILNPAPAIVLDDEFLCGIDWFTPNETEAAFYAGLSPDSEEDVRACAERLLEKGVKNVIITLGSRGAYWTNGKAEITVPSCKVKAVDTTGAGDTFNGALTVAIATELGGKNIDIEKIKSVLNFANRAAAISVTRPGAAASCPVREEIFSMNI